MKRASKLSWLDFFSGGVPALDYFVMQVESLKKLADESRDEHGVMSELCIIGLAAYFESFCKNEFAAVINIYPETLRRFSEKRECRITAKSLLQVISDFEHSLGFLVAEEYDFGSPKSANSLFQDLLNITPFSAKEAAKYSAFLNDRNLLVHHGGIYTAKYKGQNIVANQTGTKIYFDSLVVGKVDVQQWADFLVSIAGKIGKAASSALTQFAKSEKLRIGRERRFAIRALGPLTSISLLQVGLPNEPRNRTSKRRRR